ncbi:hypothetical protein E1A91_A11G054200v1 [Gossypium mustelinum]|uniref:Uncharacterized protein n=1 Tax=Gossypium mustelinum TaxID=34275 RepID=A0A5D2X2V8_GOSMU|nr:hypothetical protein E1A91_A11G054200v1 [Gossypium mustelinum]
MEGLLQAGSSYFYYKLRSSIDQTKVLVGEHTVNT